ncbi:hypothetical protein [Haliea sp. E17]|uniref:hypothetical protein n=1 Tax=Haliea sp. E17 TaxID=3401576 RepID=UPI003AAC9BAE
MALPKSITYLALLGGILATGSVGAEGPPTWQIEVEGLPLLSGRNVMPLNMGNIRKSNLMGANAIVNFSLVGDADLQVYGAQVYYLDSGTRCDRGHGSPGTGELVVGRDGEQILVSGKISCQTGTGEAGMRSISGWYRD